MNGIHFILYITIHLRLCISYSISFIVVYAFSWSWYIMHLIICSASVLSIEFKFHVKHNLYMRVIDIWKFSFQWYYISFDASKWSIKTRPQLPYISFVSLSIWLSLYPFDVIMSGRILLILTKCHRYQIPFMCAIWCLWHYRAQKSYHLWSSCYCWLDPVIDLTWITIN